MAKVIKRRWVGEDESGLLRRDRRSYEYEVYIPDRLVGRTIALDGLVATDVVEAETAITRSILTVQAAASLIGRSVQAAKRQLIRAFTDLERQLASPTGDTRGVPPSRGVPRRSPID